MRRPELAGQMQRTEAAEVGSYLDASRSWRGCGYGDEAHRPGHLPRGEERRRAVPESRARGGHDRRHDTAVARAHRDALRVDRQALTRRDRDRLRSPRIAARPRAPRVRADEGRRGIYIYDRARPPATPAIAGLTIERVGPGLASVYSKAGFESFNDRGPEFRSIVEIRSKRRRLRAYLGRVDGEPAATGMLFDVRPVGGLGNGSVRREFRGRGLRKAMIVHRMRDGWVRGYRIFFGQTVTPVSAHNLEDLGSQLLYRERAWERKS